MSKPLERSEIKKRICHYLMGNQDIIFAYIFGSFAEEEVDYFRDIDIAIFLKEPIKDSPFDIEIDLSNQTEGLLDYDYQIDLVVMNNKDIPLLANIIEGEILFTRDEDLWSDYVTYVAMSYNDISFYRDLYLREAYLEHQQR